MLSFSLLLLIAKRDIEQHELYTQMKKQANVACILFAEFFGTISNSIKKIFQTLKQVKITKKYHPKQEDTTTHKTIRIQHPLHHNCNTSKLTSRNYSNTPISEHISSSHSYPKSPVSHIQLHQPNIDVLYEHIVDQPSTTIFRSQSNHLLALDELPSWISELLPILPVQPSTPIFPYFPFLTHLFPLAIAKH